MHGFQKVYTFRTHFNLHTRHILNILQLYSIFEKYNRNDCELVWGTKTLGINAQNFHDFFILYSILKYIGNVN